MKYIAVFAVAAALLLGAGSAGADSWNGVVPGNVPVGSGQAGPPKPPASDRDLSFIYDEAAFLATHPGLTWEGYENSNLPPASFAQCLGPFNSETDNECYSPGAIVPGISQWATDGNDMATLSDGFFTGYSTLVGPMWFNDDPFITFDPPVATFGCLILYPNGDTPLLEIDVLGTGGVSLGTDSFTAEAENFWSAASSGDLISQINFTTGSTSSAAELFDYVYFGGEPTPVSGASWGVIKCIYR